MTATCGNVEAECRRRMVAEAVSLHSAGILPHLRAALPQRPEWAAALGQTDDFGASYLIMNIVCPKLARNI